MIPPKKIYLQTCMECPFTDGSCIEECNECKFENLAEVSWCEDIVFSSDEEYVRLKDVIEWLKENASQYIYDSEVRHWKPSEEQMKALGEMFHRGNTRILEFLYEDLEKL